MARLMIWALAALLCSTTTAQAAAILFEATLSGPAESPPNGSPASGLAKVEFDIVAHTLSVDATFSGLTTPTTAAHIHAPTSVPLIGTAGVATQVPAFAAFPLGVTSGSFFQFLMTNQASTYNPAFITAQGGSVANAETVLFNSLLQGRAYFNIHTTMFPGGEIRGFLQPVPEPGTLSIFGLSGIICLLMQRRTGTGSAFSALNTSASLR